jgi:hypothetical protein
MFRLSSSIYLKSKLLTSVSVIESYLFGPSKLSDYIGSVADIIPSYMFDYLLFLIS